MRSSTTSNRWGQSHRHLSPRSMVLSPVVPARAMSAEVAFRTSSTAYLSSTQETVGHVNGRRCVGADQAGREGRHPRQLAPNPPALRALDDAQAGTLTQGGPLGASVPCAEWWEVRFGGQISMVDLRARVQATYSWRWVSSCTLRPAARAARSVSLSRTPTSSHSRPLAWCVVRPGIGRPG